MTGHSMPLEAKVSSNLLPPFLSRTIFSPPSLDSLPRKFQSSFLGIVSQEPKSIKIKGHYMPLEATVGSNSLTLPLRVCKFLLSFLGRSPKEQDPWEPEVITSPLRTLEMSSNSLALPRSQIQSHKSLHIPLKATVSKFQLACNTCNFHRPQPCTLRLHKRVTNFSLQHVRPRGNAVWKKVALPASQSAYVGWPDVRQRS